HLLDGVRDGEVLLQPVLRGEDGGVAVRTLALEDDVGTEAVLVPLQGEEPGDGLRGGGADVAGDEVEDEVVPAHGGAGGDELAARAGGDEGALGKELDLGMDAAEGLGVAPVDGRLAAVEEAGLGEEEDAGARGAELGAAAVHARSPVDELRIAAGAPAA